MSKNKNIETALFCGLTNFFCVYNYMPQRSSRVGLIAPVKKNEEGGAFEPSYTKSSQPTKSRTSKSGSARTQTTRPQQDQS